MGDWIRALGIDYGTARIGLALSDDLGMFAHPLETVPAHDKQAAVARISLIVEEKKIDDLVIGLPLHTSGREGDAVDAVREFQTLLKSSLQRSLRWHEMDERYTTQIAMEKLHAAGRTEKNARGIIDQAAAVEILQQWLDRRSSPI